MKRVNIVFDDVFDDADILLIPDEIFSRIEEIGQEFCSGFIVLKILNIGQLSTGDNVWLRKPMDLLNG